MKMFKPIADPCVNNPCKNNGNCVRFGSGHYKCDCSTTDYFGQHCEKGIISIWSIFIVKMLTATLKKENAIISLLSKFLITDVPKNDEEKFSTATDDFFPQDSGRLLYEKENGIWFGICISNNISYWFLSISLLFLISDSQFTGIIIGGVTVFAMIMLIVLNYLCLRKHSKHSKDKGETQQGSISIILLKTMKS